MYDSVDVTCWITPPTNPLPPRHKSGWSDNDYSIRICLMKFKNLTCDKGLVNPSVNWEGGDHNKENLPPSIWVCLYTWASASSLEVKPKELLRLYNPFTDTPTCPSSELASACFLQLTWIMSGIPNPETSSFNITTACWCSDLRETAGMKWCARYVLKGCGDFLY